MDNYIYLVVETEKQEYQEAKPGRNLFFDFEDGDHYYFSSAKNVVRFIYGMAKCHDYIRTNETNPAYEFCQTYGEKYPSEQLLRGLEEDGGNYWFTVQRNYDPSKDEEFPLASFFSDAIKETRYYHILKIRLDEVVEDM
nr:MAG TPA: hypothetical protein [Caudoviricetes sp.]